MEKKNGDEQLDSIRFEREREVENRPESLLVERVQLFFFFLSLSLFSFLATNRREYPAFV